MTEKQRILSHLYMVRASIKTMLNNLQNLMNEEIADSLLDRLNEINEVIEKLENDK